MIRIHMPETSGRGLMRVVGERDEGNEDYIFMADPTSHSGEIFPGIRRPTRQSVEYFQSGRIPNEVEVAFDSPTLYTDIRGNAIAYRTRRLATGYIVVRVEGRIVFVRNRMRRCEAGIKSLEEDPVLRKAVTSNLKSKLGANEVYFE